METKYKRIVVKNGVEKVLDKGTIKDLPNLELWLQQLNKNNRLVGTYVIYK